MDFPDRGLQSEVDALRCPELWRCERPRSLCSAQWNSGVAAALIPLLGALGFVFEKARYPYLFAFVPIVNGMRKGSILAEYVDVEEAS